MPLNDEKVFRVKLQVGKCNRLIFIRKRVTTKLSHVNDINYFSFEFKYVKYCNSLITIKLIN